MNDFLVEMPELVESNYNAIDSGYHTNIGRTFQVSRAVRLAVSSRA
jgi:hypothetical protein